MGESLETIVPNSLNIHSEIGRLKRVIIHTPGQEIENMTPARAADALYDDILSLPAALDEHHQLSGTLQRFASTLEITDLLAFVLETPTVRQELLTAVCNLFEARELVEELMEMPAAALSRQLIEGTPMRKNTLERHLSPLRFMLPPLPNTFFTRDAAMCVNDRVIIGSMASRARTAEALILKTLFSHHPELHGGGFYFDGSTGRGEKLTIEGGDVLMIREDLCVIGYSERTSVRGIDALLSAMARVGTIQNAIVVELPKARATIHLDMIFTMLDTDRAMIFAPLMLGARRCRAFKFRFDNGRIAGIEDSTGLLEALRDHDIDLQPVLCGGDDDFYQEREQWNSGANFFTIAPGTIIGYGHNLRTIDALDQAGFDVVPSQSVIDGSHAVEGFQGRRVITIDGNELARGGGGCRCMTMPIERSEVPW
jgi:arginine deiminase